jgi:uncharacterized membrane-anchored protein YitT (DUF2179 family)
VKFKTALVDFKRMPKMKIVFPDNRAVPLTKRLYNFGMLNIGLVILAAGIHFFKSPNNFAMGGTSGISIIASSLIPDMNVGTFMFLVNISLIITGLVFLSVRTMGITIYSSLALSFYVWLLERLVPVLKPLTDDTFLEFCFAVILPAVGSAILFNIGASSGGTDIVALILAKKTNIQIGKALFLSDFLITLWAGFIYGVRTGLYCILGLLAKAFVVDGVIENFNVRKKVTIISQRPKEICNFIIFSLHRGATVYTARGAFTGGKKEVITTILRRSETVAVRNYVHETDPEAFMTIVNSSETIGRGFREL